MFEYTLDRDPGIQMSAVTSAFTPSNPRGATPTMVTEPVGPGRPGDRNRHRRPDNFGRTAEFPAPECVADDGHRLGSVQAVGGAEQPTRGRSQAEHLEVVAEDVAPADSYQRGGPSHDFDDSSGIVDKNAFDE